MDWLVFVVAAVATLVGALGVVLSRNPVHAALMLVMTLFGVAVLFVEQQAHFLAAVQVIVYAGAVVVLFLFVIMLIGVDKPENLRRDPLPVQRPLALALGIIGLLEVLLLARWGHWVSGAQSIGGAARGAGAGGKTNVELLADSIFTRYLLPFEATSVLLVIAVVGAVVLARRAQRAEPLDTGDDARQEAAA
jgi:NADH-quinone oxidoreductase subunit J